VDSRWRRAASCGRLAAIVVALTVALAGCLDAEPSITDRPSPTPGPPILRSQPWSFDGQAWTFSVTVNPNGDETSVVFEWGTDGAFDHLIPVEDGLFTGKQVSLTTREPPADESFCGRFRATNAFGSMVLEVACMPDLPVRTVAPS
jgi:hypothetical protein